MSANAVTAIEFAVAAAVSLGASAVFVVRLERLGARLRLSEAILGLTAALAADAPEITSAVVALMHRQRGVAVGVVLGSNVFNLAALLGIGALVAGKIRLHRRVVVMSGVPALVVVGLTGGVESGDLGVAGALAVVVALFAPYLALLSSPERTVAALRLPHRLRRSLSAAVAEDESELFEAITPRRGDRTDLVVAVAALVVVVIASTVLERLGTRLGVENGLSAVVVGGVVLAAVTSLPNAVAAVFFARHGRGAAALSTAMNSNTINVAVGLLLPAAIVGLGRPSGGGVLLAEWYAGLTTATLAVAFVRRGLGRIAGGCIVGAYVCCVGVLVTR